MKLPRAKIWLATAAGLLVLIAVGFWWNRQPGALTRRLERYRAAGQPASLAELEAAYPALPDAENALAALLEAGSGWRSAFSTNLPGSGNGPRYPARGEVWPEAQREAAREELASNAVPLAGIYSALQLPRSRVTGSFKKGLPPSFLNDLSSVKQITRLLGLEARWAAEAGDSARAANALLAQLRVIHAFEDQPFIIGYLVRIALDAIAVESAERVLSRVALPEAALERLQQAFAAAEATNSLARAISGERCLALDELNQPAAQLFAAFNPPAGAGAPASGSLPFVSLMMAQLYELSGLKRQDGDFYLDRLDEMLAAASGPSSDLRARQERLAEQVNSLQTWRGRLRPLSRQALPSLHGVLPKELRWVTTLRCAQTAMAVERWRLAHGGVLPGSLRVLVPEYLAAVPEDLMDGQLLKFRPLAPAPGYVVYSIGEDGTDDSGTERVAGSGKTNGWDYTFIVNR